MNSAFITYIQANQKKSNRELNKYNFAVLQTMKEGKELNQSALVNSRWRLLFANSEWTLAPNKKTSPLVGEAFDFSAKLKKAKSLLEVSVLGSFHHSFR